METNQHLDPVPTDIDSESSLDFDGGLCSFHNVRECGAVGIADDVENMTATLFDAGLENVIVTLLYRIPLVRTLLG
jgi:hypothetical protein